jgi:hypothetical protein
MFTVMQASATSGSVNTALTVMAMVRHLGPAPSSSRRTPGPGRHNVQDTEAAPCRHLMHDQSP